MGSTMKSSLTRLTVAEPRAPGLLCGRPSIGPCRATLANALESPCTAREHRQRGAPTPSVGNSLRYQSARSSMSVAAASTRSAHVTTCSGDAVATRDARVLPGAPRGSRYARRVVPLELRRSDIGFGRVIIDDTGVTRHRALSTQSIGWDEIRDYRLTIEIRGARLEVLYLVHLIPVLLMANDVRNGYRGAHRFRAGIELLGDDKRVAFNWRFKGVELAIAQVLQRIHPALARPVHDGFARTGIARFGDLTIGEHAIRWGDKPLLLRGAVERIELFNSSPIRLRVLAKRKAWPYGQAELSDIPNLGTALELATRQGYPVGGLELLSHGLRALVE
jgi:hypothetical protein